MKKIIFLLSVMALMIVSCTDKNAFTLTGTLNDTSFDGKNVYLQRLSLDGKGFNSLDTTTIKNGVFTFKGIAEEKPALRFVYIDDVRTNAPFIFIAEPGKIEIIIDSTGVTLKGTPLNDQYQEFDNKKNTINSRMQALGEEYRQLKDNDQLNESEDARIQAIFEENVKEMAAIIFDYTKSNITNPIGEFFFKNAGNSLDADQLRELLSLASPEFKQDEQIMYLEKQLLAMEKTETGKPFIDVTGQTPDGSTVSLSEYAGKGKIVLIDFWASWCKPCLAEMPVIVDVYKKYKNKDFEIVGISLDEDREAWKKCIKEYKMEWPQISDLKAWQSDLSQPYGVSGIPYTILLDKDGKIIEKGLYGNSLLEKLKELLD